MKDRQQMERSIKCIVRDIVSTTIIFIECPGCGHMEEMKAFNIKSACATCGKCSLRWKLQDRDYHSKIESIT